MQPAHLRQLRMPVGQIDKTVPPRSHHQTTGLQFGSVGEPQRPAIAVLLGDFHFNTEADALHDAECPGVGSPVIDHLRLGPKVMLVAIPDPMVGVHAVGAGGCQREAVIGSRKNAAQPVAFFQTDDICHALLEQLLGGHDTAGAGTNDNAGQLRTV